MTALLEAPDGQVLAVLSVAETTRHIVWHPATGPVWFERTDDDDDVPVFMQVTGEWHPC